MNTRKNVGQLDIAELEKQNRADELVLANQEKAERAAELVIANEEKEIQRAGRVIADKEKAKRVAELVIANEEKQKRADELVIADEEKQKQIARFIIADSEKAKRVAELVIANEEKQKRVAELVISDEEKQKRVAELLIADIEKQNRVAELVIANEEKAKRVAELVIANEEKAKRVAELVLANSDLKHSIQLNADKDLFISILAHDLRSPFSGFLGLSELLLQNIQKYSNDEIENMISEINKSAQNTFGLLEDLLKWARIQSGKIPFEPQKMNFSEICRDFLEIFSTLAKSKNITFNCIAADEINIFADPDMFKAIFRNIITNALKFTCNGGHIDIYAEKNNTEATITISDNGIGIKPERLIKLFNISHIKSTPGTAEETGSGLGLVICKEFVEKQGGRIWVESEYDKGSKFKFTIPLFAG